MIALVKTIDALTWERLRRDIRAIRVKNSYKFLDGMKGQSTK